MYSKKVIERFKNPRFVGELEDSDVIGEEGNMKCGDVIRFYLKIENNIIKDIKFQTYGCIAAIAASDILCELVLGKTLDNALDITYEDVLKEFGEMPAVKLHCAILGLNALKKAIKNYKEGRILDH